MMSEQEAQMAWLPKINVVVPIDFSDASFDAIAVAVEHVLAPHQVTAVHVFPRLETMEPVVVWHGLDDDERRRRVTTALEERLAELGHTEVKTAVLVGSPSRRITEHASEIGADLIVLPSHGRTGIEHWFMGSVAEQVVRRASCPVLVLRREK
jgi:nucleotide-binding universal stress UspA family protein